MQTLAENLWQEDIVPSQLSCWLPVIIISIGRPGGSESSLEETRGAAPA